MAIQFINIHVLYFTPRLLPTPYNQANFTYFLGNSLASSDPVPCEIHKKTLIRKITAEIVAEHQNLPCSARHLAGKFSDK